MNEIAILLILYTLMCFTDFVPDALTRYDMGKVFILLVSLYLLVHISLLIFDLCRNLRLHLRKKQHEKKL